MSAALDTHTDSVPPDRRATSRDRQTPVQSRRNVCTRSVARTLLLASHQPDTRHKRLSVGNSVSAHNTILTPKKATRYPSAAHRHVSLSTREQPASVPRCIQAGGACVHSSVPVRVVRQLVHRRQRHPRVHNLLQVCLVVVADTDGPGKPCSVELNHPLPGAEPAPLLVVGRPSECGGVVRERAHVSRSREQRAAASRGRRWIALVRGGERSNPPVSSSRFPVGRV